MTHRRHLSAETASVSEAARAAPDAGSARWPAARSRGSRRRLVLAPRGGGWLGRLLETYLVSFCFFLTLSLGALFFVLLQHLTRAGWSVVVRRLAEGLAGNLADPRRPGRSRAPRAALTSTTGATPRRWPRDPVLAGQERLPQPAVLHPPPGGLLRALDRARLASSAHARHGRTPPATRSLTLRMERAVRARHGGLRADRSPSPRSTC